MDIKIEREDRDANNYFETYAADQLKKYFNNYTFIESVRVFFRGQKHDSKKVKLQMRLKGKDIYAEASGPKHDIALDSAIDKIKSQIEKYKSKRYRSSKAHQKSMSSE